MKKHIFQGLLASVMIFTASAATAFQYSWRTPQVYLMPGDPIAASVGTLLAGYTITEIEYAKYLLPENTWQGDIWGDSGGSHSVWLFSGTVWASFSTPSTALAFSAGGDHNDGNTDFFIDDILVTTQNMNFFGGSLLVEGLANTAHTVRVSGTTHLDGAVALTDESNSVPEPAITFLFGTGLACLLGRKRLSSISRTARAEKA